jgi:aldehyde dehydrogenase (NAD+)
VVGIISAFNFPVAVWAWNSMLAWVCGDVCVWKPSEKVPLTAIACQKIVQKIFEANEVPAGICGLVIGDAAIGKTMAEDPRIALISATGSTRMENL